MTLLVVGPESSGTKAVAALLVDAGAQVQHRSLPANGWWPPVSEVLDYDAVVAVVRDLHATVRSQVGVHVKTEREARSHVVQAWQWIGQAAALARRFVPVTLESLALHPPASAALIEELGLSGGVTSNWIRDPNAKYYGGDVFHDPRSVEARVGGVDAPHQRAAGTS